ncbi:MAG: hypothetical protein AVDCRST_MAG36-1912 [uncultured Nocardioidaceae bacterium]|uniref:Uncharacterized protein n=1 Tax=uncultured Nocardioidaceae bacterium TaxID=253824 RepID=A0A6J4M4M9_9ACTN|nr:MAG: hypothetical protein AVDCRST_MAG36-1912 [uncultured Nocardioidaceae bacterium]
MHPSGEVVDGDHPSGPRGHEGRLDMRREEGLSPGAAFRLPAPHRLLYCAITDQNPDRGT